MNALLHESTGSITLSTTKAVETDGCRCFGTGAVVRDPNYLDLSILVQRFIIRATQFAAANGVTGLQISSSPLPEVGGYVYNPMVKFNVTLTNSTDIDFTAWSQEESINLLLRPGHAFSRWIFEKQYHDVSIVLFDDTNESYYEGRMFHNYVEPLLVYGLVA